MWGQTGLLVTTPDSLHQWEERTKSKTDAKRFFLLRNDMAKPYLEGW
ncbi:hypothetical protein B4113_2420 [Geobacillus sp. B4113_201601]|nr:hypothetical protein B4113_2420 [Geobacillus sp. B4113_201601]